MRLAIIYPAIGKQENEKYISTRHLEPLSIAALAGLSPPDVELSFFDDRLESIDYDKPADLAAISAETHTALRAYQISANYRKRGIPVVMGGFHASLMPEEAIKYVDSVVIGEAEDVWGTVIDDAKHGRLQKYYRAEKRPLMSGSMYDRRLFPPKKYLPITMIEAGRGCAHSCNFCCVGNLFGRTYNHRPLQNIIEEIIRQKSKFIVFVDDNLTANITFAKELFRALIPLKVKWAGQAPISVATDDELLGLMEKSGCICLLIGFESINKDTLRSMKKDINQKIDYVDALARIRDHGILVNASFLLGYDNDTLDSLERTLDFAIGQKVAFAYFNHLRPYPGTAIYDELRKEKRLLYESWWLDQDYHFGDVCFVPKNMSPKQLVDKCDNMKKVFYSNRCILFRGMEFRSNMRGMTRTILYYFLNLMNRREIRQKRFLKFGSVKEDEPISN